MCCGESLFSLNWVNMNNVPFLWFQMLGTTENKPSFLSDKQLEPALKQLLRRFPNIDTKAGAVSLGIVELKIDREFMFSIAEDKMTLSTEMYYLFLHEDIYMYMYIIVYCGYSLQLSQGGTLLRTTVFLEK